MNPINYLLHLDTYLATLIQTFGPLVYLILFLVLFIETGLVFFPFLPGDSLLFVAGTLSASKLLNIYILFIILSIAAIAGDSANYWIGSFFGKKVFSRFINKKYLDKTEEFYEKHGAKAIFLARFIPFIRTFAPFVAGVGKMKYSAFLTYNVIGGLTWVITFLTAGYFFGTIPLIKNNLSIVIIGIIIISFVPIVIGYIKNKP